MGADRRGGFAQLIVLVFVSLALLAIPAGAANITDPALVAQRIANAGFGCADYAPKVESDSTITIGPKDAQPTSSGTCTTGDGTILTLDVYRNGRAIQVALASARSLACSFYKGLTLYGISKDNWTVGGGSTMGHAQAAKLAKLLKGKLATIRC